MLTNGLKRITDPDFIKYSLTPVYFLQSLLIALLYIIPGWIAIQVIQPQDLMTHGAFVTGVMLAFTLHYGYAIFPGLLLGCVLVNFYVLDYAFSTQSFSLAFFLGLASLLSFATARYLIRRFLPNDKHPDDKSTVFYLLLAGPLASATGALTSALILLAYGIADINTSPGFFLLFWIEDSTGIVLVAPVVTYILTSGSMTKVRQVLLPVSLLLIAFMMVSLLFLFDLHAEKRSVEAELDRYIVRQLDEIHHSIISTENIVHSITGFYAGSNHVDRDEFGTYFRQVFAGLKNLQAVEWVPRVAAADRDEYIKRARKDGFKQFDIREKSDNGTLISAKSRAWYYPVFYIEPLAGNESALGFDLGSSPTRMQAMQRAIQSGKTTLSAPVQLVQGEKNETGILMFHPIFKNGLPVRTSQQRQQNLHGFALGVHSINQLFNEIINQSLNDRILFKVLDITDDEPIQVTKNTDRMDLNFRRRHSFQMGGRTWEIKFEPDATFLINNYSLFSWLMLLLGLAFSISSSAFIQGFYNRNKIVLSQVREQTASLARSEAQYAAILDTATAGIISIDAKGLITSVNNFALQTFGYMEDELIGKNIKMLMPSPYHEEHDGYLQNYRDTGEKKIIGSTREVLGLRKDGSTFPLELGVSEYEIDGETFYTGLVRDITDKRNAEEQIQQQNRFLVRSEARYAAILDTAASAIVTIDARGIITSTNKFLEQIFGYSAEEMHGNSINMLIPASESKNHDQYLNQYHETGEKRYIGTTREEKARRKNGEIFYVELSISEYKIDGKSNFTAILRDISERKRLEVALKSREKELSQFLNDAPVMMWMTDANNNSVLFNNTLLEFTGHTLEEEINQKWDGSSIHPDDRMGCLADYREYMQGHKQFHHEYRMKNTEGEYRWLSEVGVPRFDEQNKFDGYIGTCIDVTAKRLAEQELAENMNRLRDSEKMISEQKDYYENLINSLGAPAFVIGPDHKVITWNIACEELTGLKAVEVVGTHRQWDGFYREERPCLADVVLDADYDEIDKLYPLTIEKSGWVEGAVYSENWCDLKNGTRRYLHIMCNPLKDKRGVVKAVIEVLFDMTKVEQAQSELRRSNEELEQFAYIASHDLQEPLRMVSSYTQLLSKRYRDKLDGDALEFIDFAVDGAARMQKLIQDLLQYSRVGTRDVEFSTVDANNLYDYAVENLAMSIDETGTSVTSDDLPMIHGDAIQLRQLFQNLISNAVKYRDPEKLNKVHVSAIKKEGMIEFCVEDNGIGIEQEYFDRIFIIFKRLHTKNEYSGTGIGLTICKKIVERHGGQIWLESTAGEGTRFYFTLKAA